VLSPRLASCPVAGARVEQRVAAKQCRPVGVREQADVAHGVAGRIQRFQLDRLTDLHHVAGLQPHVLAGDLVPGPVMGQHLGAGRTHHGLVAADMVAVLVRVEDLGYLPAAFLGAGETLLVIERVDGKRLSGFGTGDQIVEVSVSVSGPDLLDDHIG
jgi:hypothetical protein